MGHHVGHETGAEALKPEAEMRRCENEERKLRSEGLGETAAQLVTTHISSVEGGWQWKAIRRSNIKYFTGQISLLRSLHLVSDHARLHIVSV